MPQDQDDTKGADAMKQAPTPGPLSRVTVSKCLCGQRGCSDYWLNGIGKFCQGSGFDKDEADLIAGLLNARLAPPAPVEASGSEREADAWKWLGQLYPNDAPSDLAYDANEMVDAFLAGSGRSDRMAKALERIADEQQYRSGYCQTDITVEPALTAEEAQTVAREALAQQTAPRPQPSGETRPTDEEIRSAIKATEYKYFGDYEFTDDQHAAVDVLVRAAQSVIRPAPVASGGQHSSAPEFPPGEVTDEWAERFCEAVNWSPDGQECKAVEGQVRCVSFRDLAKGYILSAIATQPAITSVTAPVAETAGEAHEARAIRLQAALDAAIAADDGLARAAAAEAQLDRLVDYLAGHLNGLRVGRKEAVDTVIVNLTKLIEAQATTPPVPAQDDDKLREEETEVQYEVWGAGPQGDFCAGADTLSDAQHYAVVYGQDGPVVIKVATTTRVVWAEASPALKSTAAQEGGE